MTADEAPGLGVTPIMESLTRSLNSADQNPSQRGTLNGFRRHLHTLITPFNDDFSIDRNGFAAVIEHLIEPGVHGIVTSGTTGEYYAQTIDERIELTQLAKDVIAGRLPLIVGTGAIRTEDSVVLAESARAAGADALMVNSPPYAVPTEAENAEHALAIDRAADLPIILYNYPGRPGVWGWGKLTCRSSAGQKISVPSRKAPETSTACTCWPTSIRPLRCPAAWMTRPWSSLPGVPAAG
ncbi:MAG: hypothetical protein Ct9H300mP16_13370 [Pseudomonadota bacterium]|nr:MAG: hypothetical protein Ct9H300mP16_13370 [Pseudomonadota bacterium]